ncbi:MAG TPA: MFS transporter [Kofleriaceae bacterium]|nr:MFS transporter [Kofleriaceae bacterium]
MNEMPSAPGSLRARMFGLTWLSYFSYYFTRKNYSIVKSSLGLAKSELVIVETAFSAAYALGQFVNGALADVLGPRRLVACGMILSALMATLFGLSSTLPLFVIAYGLNGLFQASGWPGNGKVMAAWFSSRERGEIMGYWGTCYQVGGIAAGASATFLLGQWGWRSAQFGPALWVAVVGVAYFLWVVDTPSDRGYADPDVEPGLSLVARRELRRRAWPLVLKNPMTWFMGANYFCMKMMRYSLIFWLPYYLEKGLGYGKGAAGYMSISFEVGGVMGVIGAGLLADRVFGRRRIAVAAVMTAGLACAMALHVYLGATSMWVTIASVALIGALLFGPDSIVSGAVSQDLGGPHAAALACGLINGLGSLGAVFQGFMVAYVSHEYGWEALFKVFLVLAVIATATLLPFFWVRPKD